MHPGKIGAYFSFTKKERTGVLVLAGLIIFIFLLPNFFSSSLKPVKNRQAFEQFKNEIAQLKTTPQPVSQKHDHTPWKEKGEDDRINFESSKKYTPAAGSALFYFDPNTITAEQWNSLGLREKTIHTIQHYLDKGGKFRSASDLQKVYGLHPDEYRRLSAYVRIESHSFVVEKKESIVFSPVRTPSTRKSFHPLVIDINTADTTAFIGLPGIGSKLANRIINFREKLGGFFAIEQVAEIYALPDSTFIKIKPFLKLADDVIKKIDVNTADANTLKQHPYIRWNIANAIVQYRRQHGDFKSMDELQQIALVTPEIFGKIGHYLRVGGY